MSKSADPDVQLLQAAADPIRLRMLRQLSLGPVCACDFTADANVRQPTISHHLRVLRETGWVSTERRGTWIYYSLKPEAAVRFRRLGDAIAVAGETSSPAPVKTRRLPVLDVDAIAVPDRRR